MTRVVGTAWLDQMLADQWVAATVHAYLLDSASAFDPATDLTLDTIPPLDRVAGPVTLANKTAAGGYFDADNAIWTLATGETAGWVVLVFDGATEADSPVISAYSEHRDGTPINYEGNGGTVSYEFHPDGAGRI